MTVAGAAVTGAEDRPRVLIVNAAVGDPDGPLAAADAVLTVGDRIRAVGRGTELRELAGGAAATVDAGGRRVIPGLVDGHAHVVRAGLTWARELRWDRPRSLEEALGLVAERASAVPAGTWIPVVGGWHPAQFAEGRGPTRADLDRVAPDHPCYVQLLYDEAVLNTAGLAAAELLQGSAPNGGEVALDRDGAPTGIVRGPGLFRHCLARIGGATLPERVDSTRSMLADLAALGLTGALDPGGIGLGPDSYAAFFELWRRGELTLRTRLYLGAGRAGTERREIEDWLRFLPRAFGDEQLRVTGIGEIVLFACWDGDGTAPFSIDAEARDELTEISRLVASAGWPMHLHAIIDESASAILDAWEAVDRQTRIAPLRFSLAHADAVADANLRRARALGAGIALQDRMVLRGGGSARAWGERAVEQAPPLRRLLELGFPLSGGTDATVVSSIDPWRSLWWLISGRLLGGGPRRAPEHRLSRAAALELYTRGSAWFSFEENERGRIAPGQLADLLILSGDYFEVPEDEIAEIRPELTLVGGRVAHAGPALRAQVQALRGFPSPPAPGAFV
ncbi:MAG: amidohydrolase [Solirubrobacteraceae bacterium]